MNRKIGSVLMLVALFLAFSYSIVLAGEHENKVDKKDAPAAVIAAFEKAYPTATIKEIEKSENSGQTMYEIVSQTGKAEIEAGYAADGTLLQVTEDITVKALPDAVKKALAADYPKGKIRDTEKITKGAAAEYEVQVIVGKEITEVVVDESGKVLSTKKKEGKKEGHGIRGEKDEDKENDKD